MLRRLILPPSIDSFDKLSNHTAGYGPAEIVHVARALKAKLGIGVKLMTGFFNDPATSDTGAKEFVDNSKERFKIFVEQMEFPARYYLPLGVRNHALGCIIDLDEQGKASILMFDSLGSDGYKDSYQFFIDTLAERFPNPKIIKTTKKFQYLEKNDYQCGDWAFWFLEEASKQQKRSLEDIAKHFDTKKDVDIPDRHELREQHIILLLDIPFQDLSDETLETEVPPLSEEVTEKLAKALVDVFEKLQLLLLKIEFELGRLIEVQKESTATNNKKFRSSSARVSSHGHFKTKKISPPGTSTPSVRKSLI